jgi:ubiquinone biosynthesis protein UbiJ
MAPTAPTSYHLMVPGPDALGARAFNRALDRAPWARERLLPHASRRIAIALGPVALDLRITAEGRFEATGSAATPADLRLAFSPLTLPSFLADPTRWNEFVVEEGDVALGGTLKDLAQTLPWVVEDAFASTFGAMAGQRLADAGRRLLGFPEYAAERLADSAVSYARDEAGLLARGDEMRPFAEQNALLAARVDAAEARLDALASGLPGRAQTGPAVPA